jgi:hypothetical protein
MAVRRCADTPLASLVGLNMGDGDPDWIPVLARRLTTRVRRVRQCGSDRAAPGAASSMQATPYQKEKVVFGGAKGSRRRTKSPGATYRPTPWRRPLRQNRTRDEICRPVCKTGNAASTPTYNALTASASCAESRAVPYSAAACDCDAAQLVRERPSQRQFPAVAAGFRRRRQIGPSCTWRGAPIAPRAMCHDRLSVSANIVAGSVSVDTPPGDVDMMRRTEHR